MKLTLFMIKKGVQLNRPKWCNRTTNYLFQKYHLDFMNIYSRESLLESPLVSFTYLAHYLEPIYFNTLYEQAYYNYYYEYIA